MSKENKIKFLATEVMGWLEHWGVDGNTGDDICLWITKPTGQGLAIDKWNPFSNWHDCGMLIEKSHENGHSICVTRSLTGWATQAADDGELGGYATIKKDLKESIVESILNAHDYKEDK